MKTITQEESSRQKAYTENVKEFFAGQEAPKALVITYGCQQNENDSERICGMLAAMGYSFTEDKSEADLILYNTCAVREGAE
ncbi:MAG: tRNA (N6-isopentenyl adenosine(37)-C2)-methylthiotransferase MiaB, partial [Clostridia bacterium]|nr:tRNA (N6-isopentenyl adenosine(37)-C2)-methylthiotransferase MiaB [Clostridia bacterium]